MTARLIEPLCRWIFLSTTCRWMDANRKMSETSANRDCFFGSSLVLPNHDCERDVKSDQLSFWSKRAFLALGAILSSYVVYEGVTTGALRLRNGSFVVRTENNFVFWWGVVGLSLFATLCVVCAVYELSTKFRARKS